MPPPPKQIKSSCCSTGIKSPGCVLLDWNLLEGRVLSNLSSYVFKQRIRPGSLKNKLLVPHDAQVQTSCFFSPDSHGLLAIFNHGTMEYS